MQLFKFSERCEVQGNVYGQGQAVAFDDAFDLSELPGEVVQEASVFVEHRAVQ